MDFFLHRLLYGAPSQCVVYVRVFRRIPNLIDRSCLMYSEDGGPLALTVFECDQKASLSLVSFRGKTRQKERPGYFVIDPSTLSQHSGKKGDEGNFDYIRACQSTFTHQKPPTSSSSTIGSLIS